MYSYVHMYSLTKLKQYTYPFLLEAERGELGTKVEVEDMELVDPSLVAAALDEDGEEVDPVLGNCCCCCPSSCII